MNCTEFRNVIHELAREETPGDAALISALTHAESCRECDALLREAEQLTADLRSLAAQHKSEAPPARVETALLEALRQRHSPAPVRKALGWLAVSAAGLAAAALLGVLLTGYPAGRSPESPRAPAAAPRESNRPLGPRELWADYAAEGETAEEAAAAFIPLAAAFDPSWLEGGAIVRVVLSRPALQSLGVPVSAGGNSEMIADMVVSSDGTPEAIRFVDWQVSDIQ
jgi:predicted anti-sigma-YlaC factor YlaD